MQYNILADAYTWGWYADVFCNTKDKRFLEFEQRFPLISEEIESSQPDLMCLCEVDKVEESYNPLLERLGYEYKMASRRGKDNVVIAYKPKVFKILDSWEIQHDELAEKFPIMQPGQ